MSTRGNICIKVRKKDYDLVNSKINSVEEVSDKLPYIYIYNHFDSYIEGLGKTLVEEYNTYSRALDLILEGDCSSPSSPYTSAGESYESNKPRIAMFPSEALKEEYLYVFEDNYWSAFDKHGIKLALPKGEKSFPNVFLGGTCNGSTWRDEIIPLLDKYNITYFNPVVEDWTPECQVIEDEHKESDDFNLFVITKEMMGVFSIAEAVDSSNKYPEHTIFCIIPDGFSEGALRSLYATEKIIKNNGAFVFNSIEEIVEFLRIYFHK